MTSVGSLLKETRLKKREELKKISEKLFISLRYLEALENEDYSVFPSETYILGFLKNYGDYLGIDNKLLMNAYSSSKIENIPAPLQELTKPVETGSAKIIGILSGIAVIILFFIALLIFKMYNNNSLVSSVHTKEQAKKIEYTEDTILNEENIINRVLIKKETSELLRLNQGLRFTFNNHDFLFFLHKIDIDGIIIKIGNTTEKLVIGKSTHIKFPDSKYDFIFKVKGITTHSATILIKTPDVKDENMNRFCKNDIIADATKKLDITEAENNFGNIVFEAVATEATWLQVFLDGEEQAKTMYRGDRVHYEANEIMQLKIGNAGGLNVMINGKRLRLGAPGEVANKVIKWKRDPYNPQKYYLQIENWQ